MDETEHKANGFIAEIIKDTRAKCQVEYAAEAANLRNTINEAQAQFVDKIEEAFEAYFHMLETGKPKVVRRRRKRISFSSLPVKDVEANGIVAEGGADVTEAE